MPMNGVPNARAILLCSIFLGLWTTGSLRAETSSPCRTDNREKHSFVVCELDLRHYELKLLWKNPDGDVYGSLRNIPHSDPSNGGTLVFATNGGMYRPDRSPVGLYIED